MPVKCQQGQLSFSVKAKCNILYLWILRVLPKAEPKDFTQPGSIEKSLCLCLVQQNHNTFNINIIVLSL